MEILDSRRYRGNPVDSTVSWQERARERKANKGVIRILPLRTTVRTESDASYVLLCLKKDLDLFPRVVTRSERHIGVDKISQADGDEVIPSTSCTARCNRLMRALTMRSEFTNY